MVAGEQRHVVCDPQPGITTVTSYLGTVDNFDLSHIGSRKAGHTMSMDELKNKAEGVAGQAKEAAGEATDNDSLKNEGRADQAKSDIKEKANELKDKASDAFNKIVGDAKN